MFCRERSPKMATSVRSFCDAESNDLVPANGSRTWRWELQSGSRRNYRERREQHMNYARSPILWVATLVLSYVLDSAAQTAPQCQLSPASAETLTAFSTQTKGSALHRMQGLVYLEVGCFSEARALFEQSKNEALDETDISRDAQQAWAEY